MTTAREDGVPPQRSVHHWHAPGGRLAYDRWGTAGRPVLLLHGPLFDTTMWWPVAAELAGQCTVVAVDLPGHGDSSPRDGYRPEALVDELAELIDHLGCRRAPVVVGHGLSAWLACLFGARFAVRGIVTVGQRLDVWPPARFPDAASLVADLGVSTIPSMYRCLAEPHLDETLLAACRPWTAGRTPAELLRGIHEPHLNVFGTGPADDYASWLRRLTPTARCVVYDRPGQFPHLHDVDRFAADVRDLL